VDTDAELLSDHRPIVISLGRCEKSCERRVKTCRRLPRWVTSKLDKDRVEAAALAALGCLSESLGAEEVCKS